MASSTKDLMKFEEAVNYMEPLQVAEYLQKILDFFKRNNSELCFPNISSYTEAFLVNLASDNRNLKNKCLKYESKDLGLEIIEVLEMSREVFRWTYAYVHGNVNKNSLTSSDKSASTDQSCKPNLLVYRKLYTNKVVMKPSEIKKQIAIKSTRLKPDVQNSDVSTGRKIQLLNMTLKFIKDDRKKILDYPDMPLAESQYIYDLINDPRADSNVGFGYKSLHSRLFEALEEHGVDYEFRITFVAVNGSDNPGLKLEKKAKIQRKVTFKENASRDSDLENSLQKDEFKEHIPLNDSTQEHHSKRSQKLAAKQEVVDGVSTRFIEETLQRVLMFTADGEQGSVSFDKLSEEEAAFVKGLRSMARSPKCQDMFEPRFLGVLEQIDRNINEVLNTCKLKVEQGLSDDGKGRFIKLKKVLIAEKSTIKLESVGRGSSSTKINETIVKDKRIQFESVGAEIIKPIPMNMVEGDTDMENTTDKKESVKRTNGLCKRKAKLLEDLSVPVESDKGTRMMKLMGWDGGALGVRGEGILEPIVPAIERATHAGLGHVPPPKKAPAEGSTFHMVFLDAVHVLLLNEKASKEVKFSKQLTGKNKKYASTAIKNLNLRKTVPVGDKGETEKLNLVLHLLSRDLSVGLGVEISKDSLRMTLNKFTIPTARQITKTQVEKIQEITPKKPEPIKPITVLSGIKEHYDIISEENVMDIAKLITTICKTPIAVKARATRVLLLSRFIDIVKGDLVEREFRFEGTPQKKLRDFLTEVVGSLNDKSRSGYIVDEEVALYEELKERTRGWDVSIQFLNPSKFVFKKVKKTVTNAEYQSRFTNTKWPKFTIENNNNNNEQTDNQNLNSHEIGDNENEINKVRDELTKEETVTNVNYKKIKLVSVDSINDEDVNAKRTYCDLERKDNEDDAKIVTKKNIAKKEKTETKINCDKKVDETESLDDIKDLEKAIEAINFKDLDESNKMVDETEVLDDVKELETVLEYNVDASKNAEGSHFVTSNSVNLREVKPNKAKLNNQEKLLVISPKDKTIKITEDIVKDIQVLILKEIDQCVGITPMLKCYGLGNHGLIYSVVNEIDDVWLKNVISVANLDLNISECVGSDEKNHKMVVRINSCIPLDAITVFKRIERYNDGLKTTGWNVLGQEICKYFVLFIVEVDETSFKYISDEDFSLYCGLDKAQFSVF